jgi:hypothetical protein
MFLRPLTGRDILGGRWPNCMGLTAATCFWEGCSDRGMSRQKTSQTS